MDVPFEPLSQHPCNLQRSKGNDSFERTILRTYQYFDDNVKNPMAYFATEYTIHFDDTMAYGSHHFLTSFKFQCAAREAFLFGERIFDVDGVRSALDRIHLLTVDAYARNLSPARLGDRLAILLTLEEWGQGSARFCYRVLGERGQSICAGFQTLICADALTQVPMPLPAQLHQAMNAMRELEEPRAADSFRERVLAGGRRMDSLFGDRERQAARQFLSQRYPCPKIITIDDLSTVVVAAEDLDQNINRSETAESAETDESNVQDQPEVWLFAGQAAFDPKLLSQRVESFLTQIPSGREVLAQCAALVAEMIGGNASNLFSTADKIAAAVADAPALSQVAIHLQNVLGAQLWQAQGHRPTTLIGHSFGEIAALGVAGCFDLLTGIRIVCLRVNAIVQHAPPGGGLLVVSLDRSNAATEAKLLGFDDVVVAGRNHATQTVLSGPTDQLRRLQEHLKSIAINAVQIASPTSFHHPCLRLAAWHWREELRKLALAPPRLPVYSPIGRRYILPSDNIADVLAGQLLRPFDLQGAVIDAVKSGAKRFVDCGSSGALARLISKAGPPNLDIICSTTVCSTTSGAATQSVVRQIAPVPQVSTDPQVSADPEIFADPQVSAVPQVAIVGRGCILPGGANSPEKLFTAIKERRLGIVDQRRFDAHWSQDFYSEKLTPDRSSSHLTGRVDDQDIAAPAGIDAQRFAQFSRTQRLLCVALAPCVESLAGAERVLCFVGATADGFEDQDIVLSLRHAGIDPSDRDVDARMHTAQSKYHSPHSAIQEVFDRVVRPGLKVTLVDAACASSMYAVSLGMQALESNQADAVIAGGVFCPGPGNSCLFSQFRGTTSTGCRPFDAHADGVVFSEGAALVTLRRRSDAEQQGLPVHAIILGAGLSSDGKSSSANVPQTRGQLLSLERCYSQYNIDPASIAAIEGHGTSTPVGDSTELETLRQYFAEHTTSPIPIHSLKGLLGHSGWAAGTASMIAVCEYLRRREFPAQAMFGEPSAALLKSQDTLTIATTPVALSAGRCRIAIDGFGFGGANAHLVLEGYVKSESTRSSKRTKQPLLASNQVAAIEDELVFVACHFEQPSQSGSGASRFDRGSIGLPKNFVVLPELADDMDISQKLATIVTERVLRDIPSFDEELRRETSLILAMSGKTERGIEATLRIMGHRFLRVLHTDQRSVERMTTACQAARPSGAYTLQCMMPNVAAGRAALLLNLNGPNFVVDADENSLAAAFEAAALLLRSGVKAGTKLAVVAAIDANSSSQSRAASLTNAPEFAAAFVIATRSFAQARGLTIVSTVSDALRIAGNSSQTVDRPLRSFEPVRRLLESLGVSPQAVQTGLSAAPFKSQSRAAAEPLATSPQAGLSGDRSRIFCPVWIEKPLVADTLESIEQRTNSRLVIVPAEYEHLSELLCELSHVGGRFLVAQVGQAELENNPTLKHSNLMRVDLSNDQEISDALERISASEPDVVIVVDQMVSWDRLEALRSIACDNSLCEFMFLVAQRAAMRLEAGSLELWGICIDGWNGREAHPRSGAIAGLLKSIQREYPSARAATICSRNLAPSRLLKCLAQERSESDREQEIILDGEMRLVRRLRPASDDQGPAGQVTLDAESVVVATGGAKGVTAVMLDALLRDSRCTVIAIGRSQLEAGPADFDTAAVEQAYYARARRDNPAITLNEMKKSFEASRARWEAHQTIEQLSRLPGRVEYLVADVTDRVQMDRVIEHVIARFGRIDLLLHGAGIQKSKRLSDRTLADFRQTFAIKVAGFNNLVDGCYDRLGRVVNAHVLTSAYSVFGNDGQHDYGAANETLDRLCSLNDAGSQCTWSSLAWLAWDGIGMTRGSEYRILAKKRRLTLIGPKDGQRLFRAVMAGQTGSAINVPLTSAEHVEYAVKTIPWGAAKSRGRVRELRVKMSSIECLPFHKVRNTPTLPGAWILDYFVEASRQLAPRDRQATNVTVRDMTFQRFVRFADHREPNLRVVAEQAGNEINVWLLADVLHPTGVTLSKDVVCASARILFDADASDTSETLFRAANPRHLNRAVLDPYCKNRQEVALSGMFECLSEIEIGADRRRAKFTPSRVQSSSQNIPALLLDAAWRLGAMYAISGDDHVFVPVSIGRMRLPLQTNAAPSSAAGWEICSTAPRSENRTVRWDRTEVVDAAGHVRLTVEDAFATRLL